MIFFRRFPSESACSTDLSVARLRELLPFGLVCGNSRRPLANVAATFRFIPSRA
ncbi:MAG TPA: hypothetical protein IAB02_02180 [Candidatus Pullichristensenella excrementigallinarum]|uniref:Uncharacterized protein n=1 Tax=Candidatus Pullichristensenella excrementigallinarum TaxID=2840907 RepID=A0A9D1I9L7_9FIRM|nr:hypothetical protein [Candidatus Pullichristensenella excrementigallinarum]